MSMNQLEQARQKIDQLDRELSQLYEKRMACVKQVLAYKKDNGLPILDAKREQAVLNKHLTYLNDPELAPFYASFVQAMMANSRAYQEHLLALGKVAYCGVPGAFAYSASRQLFPGYPLEGMDSFDQVIEAVQTHQVEFGVLPLENTSSGLVGEVLDGLFSHEVYIQRVLDVVVEPCLLGVKGATLKDVRFVYSKDQALLQAKQFLSQLDVQTVAYPNTAMAAQYVARENDIHKAAVGAKENAEFYGLTVLANHIADVVGNTTRFLVISPTLMTEGQQTAFLFTTGHTSGALAKVINLIADAGLNMSSIQSRPIKGRQFEYYFYVEVDGGLHQESVAHCLKEMSRICETVRCLGSYTKGE